MISRQTGTNVPRVASSLNSSNVVCCHTVSLLALRRTRARRPPSRPRAARGARSTTRTADTPARPASPGRRSCRRPARRATAEQPRLLRVVDQVVHHVPVHRAPRRSATRPRRRATCPTGVVLTSRSQPGAGGQAAARRRARRPGSRPGPARRAATSTRAPRDGNAQAAVRAGAAGAEDDARAGLERRRPAPFERREKAGDVEVASLPAARRAPQRVERAESPRRRRRRRARARTASSLSGAVTLTPGTPNASRRQEHSSASAVSSGT